MGTRMKRNVTRARAGRIMYGGTPIQTLITFRNNSPIMVSL
jgi:hypothetical protein